jgi:hypothetical protein
MSKNWYQLNINIDNAVRKDFDINKLISESGQQNPKSVLMWAWEKHEVNKIVTDEWIEYMSSLGLDIYLIKIFYRRPYTTDLGGHIDDTDYKGEKMDVAVNWIIGQDDSQMIWYDINNDAVGLDRLTPVNDRYQLFKFEELTEIERHTIGNTPTLVRVNVPHSIELNSDTPRISISVRLEDRKLPNNEYKKWDQIVKQFRNFII